MGDSNVRVPPDSTGKKIDAASLDVGADTVYRQRIVLADNAATQEFATVVGGKLAVQLDAISATVQVAIATPFTINAVSATVQVAIATPFTVNNISATVAAVLGAGTANIGNINHISRTVQVAVATPFTVNNISATVAVAGVVGLTAGTAVIGDINAISRTVQVAIATPFTLNNISATVAAVLGAGTANIGILNHISATVQVAIGTPFTINNISATVAAVLGAGTANIGSINNISATVSVVLGAGSANIGTLNNVSATVTVAGVVGLTAGTANIGHLNHISRTVEVTVSTPFTVNNISATVTVAVAGYTPATMAVMSVSHGPKCVTASTSANVTLVASPGAGLFVYVTQLMVGNNSSTKTLARIGTSASISTVVQPLAADGGGFVLNFDPPWKLSASEAAVCSVKPNVSQVYFTINFYVAS